MAVFTKKEFAFECGMSDTAFRQYIKRLKVSVNFDNKIDTSETINKEFLEKWKKKKTEKAGRPIPQVERDDDVQYAREVKVKQIEPEGGQEEIGQLDLFSEDELKKLPQWALEKIQRVVMIQKSAEERDLLKIKKDKIHGVVIPTELVKNLFAQHNKSVLVEFSNSVDIIVTKFSKKMKLTNEQQTDIRRDLIYEINLASNKAIDQTKKDLKTVIKQSTEARAKGEKK